MSIGLRHPMISQVNDHIWLLNDNNEATGYVVAGRDKAMVIDTMIGLVNVKEEAEKLTKLPLICVNTHGHGDHIGGNWSFDKAYMNLADKKVADEEIAEIREQAGDENIPFPEFEHIEDGQIFDLGGLKLQAYYLPGHTPGEIVILDRADRILFSGDGVIEQIWMQLRESCPIRTQIESMERIKAFRPEFDTILTGHSRHPEDAELFEALLAAAIDLENRNTANDVDYTWFGGKCKAHPYGREPRRIVYQPQAGKR